MLELLTVPLLFGKGMAFIGAAPGACYSMVPENVPLPLRYVMGTLYVASAAVSTTQITIRTAGNGQNGG